MRRGPEELVGAGFVIAPGCALARLRASGELSGAAPVGSHLFLRSRARIVRLWNAASSELVHRWALSSQPGATHVISPAPRPLFVADETLGVKIYELATPAHYNLSHNSIALV
jgi:hypothetical protein